MRGYYGNSYGANPSFNPYGSSLGLANYTSPLLHSTPLNYPQFNRPHSSPNMRLNYTDGMPISNQSGVQSNNIPTTSESSSSAPSTSTSPSSVTESPLSKPTTATLAGAYRGQRSLHSSPDSGIGGNGMHMGASGFQYSTRPGAQPSTSLLPDPFMPHHRLPLGNAGLGYDQNRHISSLLAEIDNQRTESRKVGDT